MTTCRERNCRRQPAYPGQGYCREHALKWTSAPTWMRRIADPVAMGANSSVARDLTGAIR